MHAFLMFSLYELHCINAYALAEVVSYHFAQLDRADLPAKL